MDWKSLTSKLDPFLDSAKNAGFKALDFTQKQLQNTPIVLKTMDEYTLLRGSKRFILIAYDEMEDISREAILRSPVWWAQAWSDAAEIRFLEISSTSDVARSLWVVGPLEMRVWYMGEETFHSNNLETIKQWWKTRCYDGKDIVIPADTSTEMKKGESEKVAPQETTIPSSGSQNSPSTETIKDPLGGN